MPCSDIMQRTCCRSLLLLLLELSSLLALLLLCSVGLLNGLVPALADVMLGSVVQQLAPSCGLPLQVAASCVNNSGTRDSGCRMH